MLPILQSNRLTNSKHPLYLPQGLRTPKLRPKERQVGSELLEFVKNVHNQGPDSPLVTSTLRETSDTQSKRRYETFIRLVNSAQPDLQVTTEITTVSTG